MNLDELPSATKMLHNEIVGLQPIVIAMAKVLADCDVTEAAGRARFETRSATAAERFVISSAVLRTGVAATSNDDPTAFVASTTSAHADAAPLTNVSSRSMGPDPSSAQETVWA